jgi:hypothetical protein
VHTASSLHEAVCPTRCMQAERELLRAALQDQLNQRFLCTEPLQACGGWGCILVIQVQGNLAVSIGCWLPVTGAQESLNWVSHLQLCGWVSFHVQATLR